MSEQEGAQTGGKRGWHIAAVIAGTIVVFAAIALAANAIGGGSSEGGGSSGGDEGGRIEGGTWNLVTLNGQPLLDGTRITARFAGGEVSGSSGCNNYSGSYERSGNQLTVGMLASQMMACPDPEGIMEQEYAYQAALQSAATYRTSGGQLEIMNASGAVVLVYQ